MGPEGRPQTLPLGIAASSPPSERGERGQTLPLALGERASGSPGGPAGPASSPASNPASTRAAPPSGQRQRALAGGFRDDVDDELRDIKREIVESRGLVIKTNNLTNALAADLKSISKRQMTFERRAFWNSASANLLFFVVVIGIVKLAWDARVDAVETETRGARDKVAKLEADIKAEQKHKDDRARAESAAAAFYELVRAERRKEVVDGFDTLRKEPLTRAELAFFTDAVEKAKAELSIRAYQLGLDHVRMGRWHEAATSLEESVRYTDAAAHAPGAKLQLARSYRKLGRQRDAIPLLIQLSEASSDREVMDDASMLLAECLIDIQAYNDAKSTLRQFIRRFPDSPFINDARMALADIAIKH